MRELERDTSDLAGPTGGGWLPRLAIVGRGRVGGSLAGAALRAGLDFVLAGRDDALEECRNCEAALLCVPDDQIAGACRSLTETTPPLRFVGHVSGATGLDALAAAGARGAATFSLHPLQSVPDSGADLAGVPCAVAGSNAEAERLARDLAARLEMRAFSVPEEARAAYHAAASIASNFLVALEQSAVSVLQAAGIANARELLSPLVLRTAANWSERGGRALTGPIARGDEATIARHREALRELTPELLPLYEALAARTARLAPKTQTSRASSGLRGNAAGSARVVRTVSELRSALDPRRGRGLSIGLVPTMGYLHEGHLSLLRAARERCDVVVMSLFVNPTQFAPGEDLERYPRDEARDLTLAGGAGVDLVYAPADADVYPRGFVTGVEVGGELTRVLCGDEDRRGPAHFRGVTTVVAKLLNSVEPDVVYFGQKDAQQAVVIGRMVRDLDFRARVEVLPTVREPDGLALSSRNAYLSAVDRERAAALHRSLAAAERAVASGETSTAGALAVARAELAGAGIEPEYLEARDAEELTPVKSFNGRAVLVAVAAHVGEARLIDNVVIAGRRAPANDSSE